MAYVQVSRRAAFDLDEIDQYSIKNWGQKVADKYIRDIESAIMRLSDFPDLLQEKPQISTRLRFHRVREHFLVCDIIGDNVYIVAIKNGSINLPERIFELEPYLIREAEILHNKFLKNN